LSKPNRPRFVALAELLARHHPTVPAESIALGRVLVDGRIVDSPQARVRRDAALTIVVPRRLRGDIKLSHGLDTLAIGVSGLVALDLGASAGGFTTALLNRGAARVYAVDAGVGQLRGQLRVDPRVVNLEGHNLGDLTRAVLPEPIGMVTMDLSYLALADAIPQLGSLELQHGAELMALVKPTFELRRGGLAASDADLDRAVRAAGAAARHAGWTVLGTTIAPRTGRRGAREVFLHARRR
jgi:23S rRNA (cytidine1920-2'-O)/16S rRNA (cytidine1409-2'-O)-methyltransferase